MQKYKNNVNTFELKTILMVIVPTLTHWYGSKVALPTFVYKQIQNCYSSPSFWNLHIVLLYILHKHLTIVMTNPNLRMYTSYVETS